MLRTARYGTRDLEKARTFYDAVTAALGAKRVLDMDKLSGYRGPSGGMFVIGEPLQGEPVFEAPSRSAVDAVHAKALELGGKCEGPPGFRGPPEMNFYAAYFRDPEGNKLVVVKQGPE